MRQIGKLKAHIYPFGCLFRVSIIRIANSDVLTCKISFDKFHVIAPTIELLHSGRKQWHLLRIAKSKIKVRKAEDQHEDSEGVLELHGL
jgi:hypothetical protein